MAYTSINDPSAQFQTALYTGSSSSVSPTFTGNANLQPDMMWIKSRSGATNNNIYDSSRGSTERLYPNLNSQVDTVSGMAFNSDGFTTGTNSVGDINVNGSTYVGWGWKANGGTTASNSSGSITSTVQANTTAGFSIVTYTGNGSSGASKTGSLFNFTPTNYISPAVSVSAAGNNGAQMNWGNPSFTISSGNADANGYGNFEYAVPSGYYAVCTKNLAQYG